MWIDFLKKNPKPVLQLIWGITGERPYYLDRVRKKSVDKKRKRKSSDVQPDNHSQKQTKKRLRETHPQASH
jgi:hypothetical protein